MKYFIQINILRDPEFAKFCDVLKLDDLWAGTKFHTIAGRLKEMDYLNGYVRAVTAQWNTHKPRELTSSHGWNRPEATICGLYRTFRACRISPSEKFLHNPQQ